MKTTDLKYRFLLWWARRICRIPFTVNFNKPDSDEFYAVGFAATPAASDRLNGDQLLMQRLEAANQTIAALSGTRKSRRLLKQAAKGAAKDAN